MVRIQDRINAPKKEMGGTLQTCVYIQYMVHVEGEEYICEWKKSFERPKNGAQSLSAKIDNLERNVLHLDMSLISILKNARQSSLRID